MEKPSAKSLREMCQGKPEFPKLPQWQDQRVLRGCLNGFACPASIPPALVTPPPPLFSLGSHHAPPAGESKIQIWSISIVQPPSPHWLVHKGTWLKLAQSEWTLGLITEEVLVNWDQVGLAVLEGATWREPAQEANPNRISGRQKKPVLGDSIWVWYSCAWSPTR